MKKKLIAAFAALAAGLFSGMAVKAQVGPIIDALPADRQYMQSLVAEIPGFQDMDAFAKVAALRELAFRKTPLAADSSSRFVGRMSTLPLQDALSLMEEKNSGVWCSHTAQSYVRMLKGAGYDAWVYSYGERGLLTHATVLVEVDGEIYLQDPYLNFWFEDERGAWLPFMEAMRRMASGESPPVRTAISRKPGIFQDERHALNWNDNSAEPPVCASVGTHLKCETSVSLEKFSEVHYLIEPTLDFIEARGLPRGIEFLMLFPMSVVAYYREDVPQAASMHEAIKALAAPFQLQ